jgi:hypothetical protein
MAKHLTASQLAERIGYSAATLAAWRCIGKGPRFVKFGVSQQARIRYPVAEVEAWEAAQEIHQNTGSAVAA